MVASCFENHRFNIDASAWHQGFNESLCSLRENDRFFLQGERKMTKAHSIDGKPGEPLVQSGRRSLLGELSQMDVAQRLSSTPFSGSRFREHRSPTFRLFTDLQFREQPSRSRTPRRHDRELLMRLRDKENEGGLAGNVTQEDNDQENVRPAAAVTPMGDVRLPWQTGPLNQRAPLGELLLSDRTQRDDEDEDLASVSDDEFPSENLVEALEQRIWQKGNPMYDFEIYCDP